MDLENYDMEEKSIIYFFYYFIEIDSLNLFNDIVYSLI